MSEELKKKQQERREFCKDYICGLAVGIKEALNAWEVYDKQLTEIEKGEREC